MYNVVKTAQMEPNLYMILCAKFQVVICIYFEFSEATADKHKKPFDFVLRLTPQLKSYGDVKISPKTGKA